MIFDLQNCINDSSIVKNGKIFIELVNGLDYTVHTLNMFSIKIHRFFCRAKKTCKVHTNSKSSWYRHQQKEWTTKSFKCFIATKELYIYICEQQLVLRTERKIRFVERRGVKKNPIVRLGFISMFRFYIYCTYI